MRKNKISNKPTTTVYLLLALSVSLFVASCSSEEPTLELSDEFVNNTNLYVLWNSDPNFESTPIQVEFHNAEPKTYYKLARSTNSECDIQDESTCNDYKLLAEFTHTQESASSSYYHHDNLIATRQYYHLYVNFLEYDINDTLQGSYVYDALPAAPQVHTVTAGDEEVYLDWDSAQGATSYNIYYSDSSDISTDNYTSLISTSDTEITVTSLTNDTTYYFIVVGENEFGTGGGNLTVYSATPNNNIPPSTPTNLQTIAGNTEVYLSWDLVSSANSYRVYYSTSSSVSMFSYDIVQDTNTNNYTATNLTNDVTYYFIVTASNNNGESDSTSAVSATPTSDSNALIPPSDLSALAGDQSISLSWSTVSAASSYSIYMAEVSGIASDNWQSLAGGAEFNSTTNSYLVSNLSNGTTYYFVVASVDADANMSSDSTEVSATPVLPAPNDFSAIASDKRVELSWSSVGDGISYEIYRTTDGDCTLSAHNQFDQCADSDTNASTFSATTATSVVDEGEALSNGIRYYYWLKTVRESEYSYASRISAIPFDYSAGIDFEDENDSIIFAMSGEADWLWDDTNLSALGTNASLRSGKIGDNASSCATLTVTLQEGDISFYHRTSSQSSDYLVFYVNDDFYSYLGSGDQDWTPVRVETSAGETSFKWCYEKDSGTSGNLDSVWIDEIAFNSYAAPADLTTSYLNDTGITLAGSAGGWLNCDSTADSQDCHAGRDYGVETNSSSDGSAGFSFSKVNDAGDFLDSSATSWSCVYDHVTGLLWHNEVAEATYASIIIDPNESVCGQSGWRLPRLEELRSIVDYNSSSSRYVDANYFSSIEENSSSSYWSSTVNEDSVSTRLSMNMSSGKSEDGSVNGTRAYVKVYSALEHGYLPDAWFASRYVDNRDGTISDKETNLMWQRCPYGTEWQSSSNTCAGSVSSSNWNTALTSATNDKTLEYDDWRLPNIKELASLSYHSSASNPQINTNIFPIVPEAGVFSGVKYLWSSTPSAEYSDGNTIHAYDFYDSTHSDARSYDSAAPFLLVRTIPSGLPNSPYDFVAVGGDNNVSLSWGAIAAAESYNIYIAVSSVNSVVSIIDHDYLISIDSNESDPFTVVLTDLNASDSIANGSTYHFIVTAVDGDGSESPSSLPASASPLLPFPDDFKATAGNGEVALSWMAISDINYTVHRSTDESCEVNSTTERGDCAAYKDLNYTAGSALVDVGLSNATTYYYWLEAYRDDEASRYSPSPIYAIPNAVSSNYLNDTGINIAINADGSYSDDCSSDIDDAQDCDSGRDANADTNYSGDGSYGFNFTKLDSDGFELPSDASDWACIRDNTTSLIWENNSTSVSSSTELPAIDSTASKCGQAGWRYPRLGELLSLVHYGASSAPRIDSTYFPEVTSNRFYYSQTPSSNSGEYYAVYSSDGDIYTVTLGSSSYSYFLVNDALNFGYLPDSWEEARYIINSDGSEVTDIETNLVWQRCSLGQTWNGSTCDGDADSSTWIDALQAGSALQEASGGDWRLPNIKELASLAVYGSSESAAILPSIFPNTAASYYWSSSLDRSSSSSRVYLVNFSSFATTDFSISSTSSARLVKAIASDSPAAPYGLVAEAADASVHLTWYNINSATGYKIYYSTTSPLDKAKSTEVSVSGTANSETSTHTITELTNNATYYFVVVAVDGDDESSNSAQVHATPFLPFPDDLTATAGNNQVTLSWTAVSGINYTVHRSTDESCAVSSATERVDCADYKALNYAAGSALIDSGLSNGTLYYYWLEVYRGDEPAHYYSEQPIYAIPNAIGSDRLNDTGISWAGNADTSISSDCASSTTNISQQDCSIGRDADDDTNYSGDGAYGFNFSKLDDSGNELTSDASAWSCVRDNTTGLIWQRESTSVSAFAEVAENFSQCGLSGWRYPRLSELRSIVDYGASGTNIDSDYFAISSSSFYTSTDYYNDRTVGINFNYGYDYVFDADSNSHNYLRVNGNLNNDYVEDSWANARYLLSADGSEVTDTYTNLIWQRCSFGQDWNQSSSSCTGSAITYDWEEALAAVAASADAEADWRLPNIKELSSLAAFDGSRDPAINTFIFPDTQTNANYWSSSPSNDSSNRAFFVDFGDGLQGYTSHSGNYYSRLVKSIDPTAPAAPYGLSAIAGDSNASLTWGNISSATSYRIYYSTVSGEGKNSATSIDFNSTMDEDGNTSDSTSAYTITSLANATTYYFVVTAIGSGGESDNSAQVSATPLLPFPDDFAAVVGDGNVSLSWSPPTGSDGISYSIHRSTYPECPVSANLDSSSCSGDSYAKIPDSNNDNSIVDTGLTNGERYYYWLEAFRTTDDTRISDNPISAIPDADGGYYDFEGGSLPEGFSFSGAADWYLDTSTGANETNSSLRSGAISSGERSCVSFAAYLELNNFSNDFYFYYKMQRGSSSDRLRLYVNGVLSSFDVTTSSTDWQSSSINIDNSLGSGTYTFEFCFEQGSTSTSAAAWIDELSFTPGLELSAEDFSDNVLNDSGSQFAGNASTGNNSDCSFTDSAEDNARFYDQDCHSGRDANSDTNSELDGNAGFAFTKLDSDGHDLPADAHSWACVRDEVTGLVWENASYDAVAYSAINIDSSAELCGLSGWRLPRLEELRSIVDYDRYSPAVDPYYFQYLADAFYWSSTISNTSSSYYQGVSFYDGDTTRISGGSYRYVPVNSTLNDDYLLERWPSDRYTDNQDGTVTDTYTQLIWMRCSLGQEWNSSNSSCADDPEAESSTYTWLQALALADNMNYAGADDWRLPNIKELASLLKVSVSSPTIDSTAFPNTPEATFWTSTPSFASPDNSFYVNFYSYIVVDKVDRDNSYYVRLVRSPPATAPASPYGLSLEAGDGSLSLSWSNVDGATSYNIYLSEESAISIIDFDSMVGAELYTSSGTSITINNLDNDTRYYVAVSALDNNDNESALSAELSAIPQLSFPSDFAVSAVSDGEIQLTWSAATSSLLAYNIYRSTDPTCAVGPNYSICVSNDYSTNLGASFTDSGLTNGTRYYYWLEASRSTTSETRISTEPVSAIPTDGDTAYQDFAGDDAIRGVNSFGWYLDTSIGAAGTTSSMRSGGIDHSQQSCMETYVSWQPGEFSFYYKVSSHTGTSTSDKLYFYIDDVNVTAGDLDGSGVSGSIDWTEAKYTITAVADVTLKWCYIKDSVTIAGEDAAWIDQISLPGTVATYDPENLATPLNDTGITTGGNSETGNNDSCTSNDTIDAPQDCDQGRDADSATNADADGHAGFSFTRLNADGTTYTGSGNYSTEPWHCVQDNVTGLIWEVKTDDDGLHDTNDTYSWYDTNSSTNGGSEGDINTNDNICYGYNSGKESTYCNTEAFVKRVNEAGLCGHNDWRMPDINELSSIVNLGRISPSIDTNYFPNTSSNHYWSASPSANIDSSGYAWRIYFYYGYDHIVSSGNNYHVRLVRSEH